jgi:hypothetical protein
MSSRLSDLSKIENLQSKILSLFGILLLAAMAWMVYETAHPASSARVLKPDAPDAALLITPGRAMIAAYMVIVSLSLAPTLYCAAALWLHARLPERDNEQVPAFAGMTRPRANRAEHPAWLRVQRLYRALCVAGVCVTALLAGFASEALQAEIRLTSSYLEYRQGAQRARMEFPEVRQMALRRRNRRLELTGKSRVVRIDLSVFAVPDRALLVNGILRCAPLSSTPLRVSGEYVWRRAFPQIAPTH